MSNFRHAARLIPACGLALALMVPAAGYGAPGLDSSYVEHDKGGGKGKGHGKAGKAHGKQKQKQKANKQEQRVQTQRQVNRQLERQRQLDRQRRLERERELSIQRQRRDSFRRQPSGWPRSGNLADRPGGGIVHVEGEVTAEGLRCTAVRGDDGRLYTLVGDRGHGLRPGDDIWVKGRVVHGSACRQGTTLEVHQIRDLLDRDGRWEDDRWDDRDRWEESQRRDRLDRIFGGDRDTWDDRWERDRGELVELRGRLTTAGGCRVLRTDDGRSYELSGDLRGHGRGDAVRIVGVVEGGSRCGVGPAVRVAEIGRR